MAIQGVGARRWRQEVGRRHAGRRQAGRRQARRRQARRRQEGEGQQEKKIHGGPRIRRRRDKSWERWAMSRRRSPEVKPDCLIRGSRAGRARDDGQGDPEPAGQGNVAGAIRSDPVGSRRSTFVEPYPLSRLAVPSSHPGAPGRNSPLVGIRFGWDPSPDGSRAGLIRSGITPLGRTPPVMGLPSWRLVHGLRSNSPRSP